MTLTEYFDNWIESTNAEAIFVSKSPGSEKIDYEVKGSFSSIGAMLAVLFAKLPLSYKVEVLAYISYFIEEEGLESFLGLDDIINKKNKDYLNDLQKKILEKYGGNFGEV